MNQEKIPTTYLVDSENVNDVWIRLVTNMEPQDEILVFYTEKSPHMSYEKVIELTTLSDPCFAARQTRSHRSVKTM